jgi:hypothetical protein
MPLRKQNTRRNTKTLGGRSRRLRSNTRIARNSRRQQAGARRASRRQQRRLRSRGGAPLGALPPPPPPPPPPKPATSATTYIMPTAATGESMLKFDSTGLPCSSDCAKQVTVNQLIKDVVNYPECGKFIAAETTNQSTVTYDSEKLMKELVEAAADSSLSTGAAAAVPPPPSAPSSTGAAAAVPSSTGAAAEPLATKQGLPATVYITNCTEENAVVHMKQETASAPTGYRESQIIDSTQTHIGRLSSIADSTMGFHSCVIGQLRSKLNISDTATYTFEKLFNHYTKLDSGDINIAVLHIKH